MSLGKSDDNLIINIIIIIIIIVIIPLCRIVGWVLDTGSKKGT
jgi:hypothetical protein